MKKRRKMAVVILLLLLAVGSGIITAFWAKNIFTPSIKEDVLIEVGRPRDVITEFNLTHIDPHNDMPLVPIHANEFNVNQHRNFSVIELTFTWNDAAIFETSGDVDDGFNIANATSQFLINANASFQDNENPNFVSGMSDHLIEMRFLTTTDEVEDIVEHIGLVNSSVAIEEKLQDYNLLTTKTFNSEDFTFDFELQYNHSIKVFMVVWINEDAIPADMFNITLGTIQVKIESVVGTNNWNVVDHN